jgi:hypothetical protein
MWVTVRSSLILEIATVFPLRFCSQRQPTARSTLLLLTLLSPQRALSLMIVVCTFFLRSRRSRSRSRRRGSSGHFSTAGSPGDPVVRRQPAGRCWIGTGSYLVLLSCLSGLLLKHVQYRCCNIGDVQLKHAQITVETCIIA